MSEKPTGQHLPSAGHLTQRVVFNYSAFKWLVVIKPQYIWRRAKRWTRRTGWLLGQMRADLGLGGPGRPIWLRDNPFLFKLGRAETRGLGLSLRLAAVVVLLGGLLVGGLTLQNKYSHTTAFTVILHFVFQASFPVVLFVVVSFVHVLLVANARTASSVVLADEARRATLPDLLMTPLRRAEMLLAMGVGPARAAGLLALAGLPVYALLGEFGGLTWQEIACFYLVLALLCYQPPAYAVPALSGLAPTPESPAGQFAAVPNRRAMRRASYLGVGFPIVLGVLFFGRFLGSLGGGWLTHLFSALNLPLLSGFSFLIFLSWPYYAMQALGDRLPFYHTALSPLFYVLPLVALQWAGSALSSASALSAGSVPEMHRLPLWTRAQTLVRWTARAAGVCVLGVVWRAWVESGDTAGLAKIFAVGPDWNAAGLLLLLGGFSLPNVCARALAVPPQLQESVFRAPVRVLRRALRRSLRPLGVALGVFLFVCLLGGLSPFARPVYEVAGKVLLAGVSTVFWAVGIRRALPKIGKWATNGLLYAVPFVALSVPGGSPAAAFSPVAAWVRLFAGGPGLLSQFPAWRLGPLPSFWICAAAPALAGIALMTVFPRQARQVAPVPEKSAKRAPSRNEARTAALMGWITSRTDNPLFTYEMRIRTRSGRWLDWLLVAPAGFAAIVALSLIYPDVVQGFSFLSPFRFFEGRLGGLSAAGTPHPFPELASLLLTGECYFLALRGQVIGEALITKDRQQGTWGFVLMTPLSSPQIFWGKVFGQTAAVGAAWSAAGLACLLLYAAASPLVGVGPALAAWGVGQLFVAALFVLGVSLGTALATFPQIQKTLKGASTLLVVLVIGGSMYAENALLPGGLFSDWQLLPGLLLGNSVYLLALSALLFWVAERRMTYLRGRDIVVGDGVG